MNQLHRKDQKKWTWPWASTVDDDARRFAKPQVGRFHRTVQWLILLFAVLLVGEVASFIVGTYVVIPKANFIFYRPSDIVRITLADYTNYIQTRDPVLGWPRPSSFGGKLYDRSGSRHIPAFPEPGTELVALYGDSFTYAVDVSDEEAWSNVLSEKLGARVANFGVKGYGMGQAYLRFLGNTNDASRLTILGIFPDNLKRNLNQQRYFLYQSRWYVFGQKPRLVLEAGSLRTVPLPTMSYSKYIESLLSPWEGYTDEFFLPGTPYGPIKWSFPYFLRMIKAVLSPQVRSWVSGKPGWHDFLEEGHYSQSLATAVAIAKTFVALAESRGKEVLIVMFPSESSFDLYRRTETLAWQPFTDRLAEVQIKTIDPTVGLSKYLGSRSYSELRVAKVSEYRHLNAEGNGAVADLVYEWMGEWCLSEMITRLDFCQCCRWISTCFK